MTIGVINARMNNELVIAKKIPPNGDMKNKTTAPMVNTGVMNSMILSPGPPLPPDPPGGKLYPIWRDVVEDEDDCAWAWGNFTFSWKLAKNLFVDCDFDCDDIDFKCTFDPGVTNALVDDNALNATATRSNRYGLICCIFRFDEGLFVY